MYSLWRGGKCLGHFDERGPVTHRGRRTGAFGILAPSEGMEGASSMMQTRFEMLPHSPTFQDPLPIEWIGDPSEPPTRLYASSGALEPLSPEAARGVAPDQVYEIRDERGARVDVQLVTLQLHRFASPADAKEWHDANAILGDSREFWMVSFASPPPNEELKPTVRPSSLVE
jgi:hypothetical protein